MNTNSKPNYSFTTQDQGVCGHSEQHLTFPLRFGPLLKNCLPVSDPLPSRRRVSSFRPTLRGEDNPPHVQHGGGRGQFLHHDQVEVFLERRRVGQVHHGFGAAVRAHALCARLATRGSGGARRLLSRHQLLLKDVDHLDVLPVLQQEDCVCVNSTQ